MTRSTRQQHAAEAARRFPLWFGAQCVLAIVGAYVLLQQVESVLYGRLSIGALLQLVLPAVAGSVALVLYLRRASQAPAG